MEVPETFEFPFPPYKAQEDFMKNLYKALEDKKFGIFESPTGTVSLRVKWYEFALNMGIMTMFFTFSLLILLEI